MDFGGLYRKQAAIREKYRLFERQELTPQQQINIMRALNGAHPLSFAQMVDVQQHECREGRTPRAAVRSTDKALTERLSKIFLKIQTLPRW